MLKVFWELKSKQLLYIIHHFRRYTLDPKGSKSVSMFLRNSSNTPYTFFSKTAQNDIKKSFDLSSHQNIIYYTSAKSTKRRQRAFYICKSDFYNPFMRRIASRNQKSLGKRAVLLGHPQFIIPGAVAVLAV